MHPCLLLVALEGDTATLTATTDCLSILCLFLTDPCITAVGAPVPLARNFAGYASALRRHRQEGRWGVWDNKETPYSVASSFLNDRDDICVPVELLTDLVHEDRYAFTSLLLSGCAV